MQRFQHLRAKITQGAVLEFAMLGLLAATMGYSLLSLMVHVIDRSSDGQISARLSPSGREFIQSRRLGLEVVDADTGRLIDQTRLVRPWASALAPQRNDIFANTRRRPSGPLAYEPDSSPITTTKSADIVVARLHTDGLVWWNRKSGARHFLTAPRTLFLDLTLDEATDRIYAQSIEIPDDPFARPPPHDAPRRVEHLHFDAVRDIRVYQLSTGKFLKIIRRLRIGQPVQNQPELRLFAQNGVLELAKWPTFPEGQPTIVQSFRVDEKNYSEIVRNAPQVVKWNRPSLTLVRLGRPFHSNYWASPGIFKVLPDSVSESSLKWPVWPEASQDLPEIEGYASVGHVPSYLLGPVSIHIQWRDRQLNFESYTDAFRQASDLSAAMVSPSSLRLAGDDGTIFECDPLAPKESRLWRIPLPPHETLPRDAIVAFGAVAIAWVVFAAWNRMLFIKQGWLALICLLTWPVVLWGIERAFSSDPLHNQIAARAVGASIFLLCVCFVGLFLGKGRSRAALLAPCMLLALLLAGASLTYAGRGPVSFYNLFHTTSIL